MHPERVVIARVSAVVTVAGTIVVAGAIRALGSLLKGTSSQ
jgi:hypothetical protein